MRIISFIYKKTVIKKILTPLNIFEEKKKQRAPPSAIPNDHPPEFVLYNDSWPGYDEPVFDFLRNSMTANGCVCPNLGFHNVNIQNRAKPLSISVTED